MDTILVRDVMQTDILSVPEKTTLKDALVAMIDKGSSYLLVVLGPYPVGIITERDITRVFSEILQQRQQMDIAVDDIMTVLPLCVNAEASFEDALMLSISRKIRHLPVVDAEDRLIGLVTQGDLLSTYASVMDRQALLENNIAQLKMLTLEDPLLGIGNRRAMEVDLSFTEAESRRHHRSFAIALLDIDFFKKYNDHYGHQKGDEALKAVAQCIKVTVRESDRVFRYGGEEILVLMPETELGEASVVAERVRNAVYALNIEHVEAPTGILSISGGVASALEGDWHQMVEAADQALYAAKNGGRNQIAKTNLRM